MRLKLRLENYLYLRTQARFIGNYALKYIVRVEHKMEPADAVLGLEGVLTEFLEEVLAAAVSVVAVVDELYTVHVAERDIGFARKIEMKRDRYEIGWRERYFFPPSDAPSSHPWPTSSSSAKVPFLFLEPANGERDASGTVVDGTSVGLNKVLRVCRRRRWAALRASGPLGHNIHNDLR